MPVIVGEVIEKDGKYLLVQEARKCREKWNLPAGHLDIGEMSDKVIYENYDNPALGKFSEKWPREASRGVVKFPDGDILIFLKEKIDQYKLPGGGKEDDETPEETFVREVREETGYGIKNIRKLGITKGYTQMSYIFVAEPDGEAEEFRPDEDEIKQGAKCLKMNPEEVLSKMKKFIDEREGKTDDESLIQYYITLRDYKILKYILDEKNV